MSLAHSATLYRHDEQGKKDTDTPIARVTVDENAMVEVRMLDGTVLVSMSLESLGYFLMWDMYPVSSPMRGGYVRVRRVNASQ